MRSPACTLHPVGAHFLLAQPHAISFRCTRMHSPYAFCVRWALRGLEVRFRLLTIDFARGRIDDGDALKLFFVQFFHLQCVGAVGVPDEDNGLPV